MQDYEGLQEWLLWLERQRPPSKKAKVDALLSEKIARIHRDSRGIYGAPRIHFELRTLGVRCARKRVARLMREKPVSSAAEEVSS